MATLNQQSTAQFVGEIGMDVPAWLQNYLVEVRSHIERLTTDPTQPGGVLGLTVTKNNLGNLISWSAPVVGAAYQVFRNSSGDFTTATQIAELQGHNNISFFDGVDQVTAAQTRYYWVRALNAAGLGGPISAVATSTNFAADGTSTAVGVDAVAAGTGGTAVGRSAASGTGARNTAVGVSSTIGGTGTDCTGVGQNTSITGGNRQTAIGAGVVTSAVNCTAVGAFSSATGTDGTALGAFATTGSGLVNVTIGWNAQCGSTDENTAVGALSVANGGSTVAVGKSASAQGAFSVAAGVSCAVAVGADRSTGIGYNVTINHTDCVVIGKDGTSTTSNQVIIGTASSVASDIWFGRGVTHSGAPAGVIIHATDGTGSDVGGDNIILQSGQPTGAGGPGIIAFYTSIAGASGSILRTAAERMRVHTNGYVGINTTNPATNLAVAGNAVFGAQGGYTTNSILSIGKGSAVAPGDLSISSGSAYGFVTGVIAEVTANSTSVIGGYVYSGTVISGGVTLTNQYGLYVDAISKSGGTVTTGTGLYVATPTAGTTNIAATFAGAGGVQLGGIISQYKGVTTNGLGVPAIYKSGRSTAQTAAVASVAAYTNAAVDGSFLVSANVNVTTSTLHNFTVTVAYTDETNTARTLTLTFAQLAGTLVTAITNATGAGPYEGIPLHIRCKASTAITIATTGTFTTVTYNVEGYITQIG